MSGEGAIGEFAIGEEGVETSVEVIVPGIAARTLTTKYAPIIESDKKFPLDPSGIENIDFAMFLWLEKEMDIYASTNKGFKKVPVIWASGERSHQIKNNKDLRDRHGAFILPLITLERTSMTKDLKKKGKFYANIPGVNDERGGSITIAEEINQDKTSNFANAKMKRKFNQPNFKDINEKVVVKYKIIPLPTYVSMTYVIDFKSEYQQQMNNMLQPFMTFTGAVNYFIIEHEGHRYEAFLKSDFSAENNVKNLQENERLFHTTMTIEVLGHLVTRGPNEEQPKVVTRENIVDIKINREYSISDEDVKKLKIW